MGGGDTGIDVKVVRPSIRADEASAILGINGPLEHLGMV